MRRPHLLLLGTIALAPSTALAVPAYTILDLGTLGGTNSFGAGINVNACRELRSFMKKRWSERYVI